MAVAELIFLGAAGDEPDDSLCLDGDVLEPGTVIPLVRRRSPWNARRAVQRVIIGCLPTRSDVFLEGPEICPEHLRFYVPAELTVPTRNSVSSIAFSKSSDLSSNLRLIMFAKMRLLICYPDL